MKTFTLCSIILFCAGCSEFVAGVTGGAATTETLHAWQQNLEAKQAELQSRYNAVLAEIEAAPDPNALAMARKKLEAVQDMQLANESALVTVKSLLAMPKPDADTRGDWQQWLAALIASVGALGYQTWTKKTVANKYAAHKDGQIKFNLENPEAAKALYEIIGNSRNARGIK
ncbi:MAG: hypothetical protein AMJ75_00475 [Phycisphaerae bacterium SM1_79]|nr:MAG: hypothetical protein AMJ75_00475 [Phycisphaerae bacterium SM1_79]